jgi:hypothetical protein
MRILAAINPPEAIQKILVCLIPLAQKWSGSILMKDFPKNNK